MKVGFVHRGGEGMASYRYRAQIPAEQISKINGFKTSINEGEADVIIFSKPVHDDIELAKQCKKDGTKIIVDFCDDHFNHPKLGLTYREMLVLADQVVCSTKALQETLHNLAASAEVIPDPYEQPRMEPHAKGLNLLWFGHQRNLGEITPYVGKYENLAVCTGKNDKVTGYTPWSLETQASELAYANIVLLPPTQEYKSPNRLINSIMAGCFVLAHPTKVRKEFREYVWVGDLTTGYNWVRAFQNDLNGLIRMGQNYIEQTYSPEIIGKQWAEIL